MTEHQEIDLLHGVPAIAKCLGLTPAQVYHLHGKGKLPTFKMGKVVCARRPTLAKWLSEQEAAGRPEETDPTEGADQSEGAPND